MASQDVAAPEGLDEVELSVEAIRERYDLDLQRRLPLLLAILGGVVTMFTLSHFVLQPPELRKILVPVDGSTAAIYALLYAAMRRKLIPSRGAHVVVVVMATLQTLNTAFEFTQSRDAMLSIYFMVIGLGVALLCFDRLWFGVGLGATVAIWVGCGAWAEWPIEVQRANLSIAVGAIFSTIVFATRRRSHIREVRLREHDAMQARLLAAERDRADRANRAKSQFLANMSHELRTPLNAILGYSEMLEETAEEDGRDQDVKDLQRIEGAGKHLLRLINELLDLAKIEAGGVELERIEVPLRGVLQEVIDTARPLAEQKANELVLDYRSEHETIESDPTRLRQCALNLLSNASKFTEAGTITLRVEDAGPDLLLRIIDTGIGMTPEQAARIFDPFVQAEASTTRRFGGTGIGLAITRQLARLLGGDLTVDSEEGVGSTFTLRIARRLPEPNED